MLNSSPDFSHGMPFRHWLLALWVLLFAIAFAFFAFWNKPLYFFFLRLLPLFYAGLIIAAFAGLGFPLTARIQSRNSALMIWLTSVAFGCGLTTLFVFATGIAGFIHPALYAAWYGAGLLLCVPAAKKLYDLRNPAVRKINTWDYLGLGLLLFVLVSSFAFYLAPEASGDALAYHLLLPKIYLSLGEIRELPLFKEACYPTLAEYNYLPLLLLFDETTCKLLHFGMGLCVLGVIIGLVRKLDPDCSPWPAVAFFASMPVVTLQFGWAWNDFFITFFILLSLYFLLDFDRERGNSHAMAAGITAALAGWTKYSFLLFLPFLLVLFVILMRRRRLSIERVVAFALPFVLVSSVWILRNYVYSGNPVYPLFNDIFKSPYSTPAADAFFASDITDFYMDWTWSTYLLFPFLLTFAPRVIDVHVGLLPLLFAPLLIARSRGYCHRVLLLYTAITILVWLIGHPGIRTLFSFFAIIFVLASIRLQTILWKPSVIRNVVFGCLALNTLANFVLIQVSVDYIFSPFAYVIGRESKEQYISRVSPSQPVYDFLNKSTRPGKALLVSMHDPLYLKRPAYFSGRNDVPIVEILLDGAHTKDEMVARLKNLGITYIALSRAGYRLQSQGGLYTWPLEQKKQFEAMLQMYCRLEFQKETFYVFGLVSSDSQSQ